MPEQWDLQTTDNRKADQLNTFIIFCEDEVSEPFYFNSFEQSGRVKINTIPNQKHSKLNLISTIDYCRLNGLVIFEDDAYRLNEARNENVWCVYDRDMENTNPADINPVRNTEFDTAIQTATAAGLNVAWSNDAFELWILLHFEVVPTGQILHRNYIYERLTEVFRVMHPANLEFQAIILHPMFNYKYAFKNKVNFLLYVLPLLKERTEFARVNATALEQHFQANIPFHLRNPCTKVHILATQLLAG